MSEWCYLLEQTLIAGTVTMFQPVLSKLPEKSAVSAEKGSKTKMPEKKKPNCVPISQTRAQKILATCNESGTSGRVARRVLPSSRKILPPGDRTARGQTVGESQRVPGGPRYPNKQMSPQSNSWQPAEEPRKPPVPVPKRSGKTLFAGIGKKVTSMVRARMAFQTTRKKAGDDLSSMEYVHEIMPKVPRFSSFLSAEAQYAMLMGYEDELHRELTLSNPEYGSMLRRTKTPMFRVSIMKRYLGQNPSVMNPGSGGVDADEDDSDEETARVPEMKEQDEFWTMDSRDNSEASTVSNLRRSKTMPKMVPLGRRLQLSYRMESAMDILDTIRVRQGDAPISPRVRANRRIIAPIRDYKSWSNVWKKEFAPGDRIRYSAKARV